MTSTVAKVKSLHERGQCGDGEGLYFYVAKNGSSSQRWIQLIDIDGKRRVLGLGGYPHVSLAQARRRTAESTAALVDGRNPMIERRRAVTPTFGEAALGRRQSSYLAQ